MKDITFTFYTKALTVNESEKGFIIEGIASTSDIDRDDEIISDEALDKAQHDLLTNNVVLFNHDHAHPIGKVIKTWKTPGKLWIRARLSDTAKDIQTMIKEGILKAFSIGGKVLKMAKEFDKEVNRTVNVIKDITLYEVSVVPIPANPNATMTSYISKSIQEAILMKQRNIKKEVGQDTGRPGVQDPKDPNAYPETYQKLKEAYENLMRQHTAMKEAMRKQEMPIAAAAKRKEEGEMPMPMKAKEEAYGEGEDPYKYWEDKKKEEGCKEAEEEEEEDSEEPVMKTPVRETDEGLVKEEEEEEEDAEDSLRKRKMQKAKMLSKEAAQKISRIKMLIKELEEAKATPPPSNPQDYAEQLQNKIVELENRIRTLEAMEATEPEHAEEMEGKAVILNPEQHKPMEKAYSVGSYLIMKRQVNEDLAPAAGSDKNKPAATVASGSNTTPNNLSGRHVGIDKATLEDFKKMNPEHLKNFLQDFIDQFGSLLPIVSISSDALGPSHGPGGVIGQPLKDLGKSIVKNSMHSMHNVQLGGYVKEVPRMGAPENVIGKPVRKGLIGKESGDTQNNTGQNFLKFISQH